WVAARPGAELAVRGVDVILNPSASHFAFGKRDVRRRLVLEGSRAFGVTYIYANLVGNEAGRVIYDGDALIATAGAVIAEARRFSYARHELVTAVVDVELTRTRHGWLSSFSPEVELEPGERVSADFEFPAARLEPCTIDVPAWEASPSLREEELARAIPLALFDYLRKSRAQGFVVSLSGGADSAAVACFVGLMVRFALAELGVDGVRERLAHIPALGDANDARSITERLLTTVYQSTRNNSPVTRAAARA